MSPSDLVHPDDKDFLRQKIAERLAGVPRNTIVLKDRKKTAPSFIAKP